MSQIKVKGNASGTGVFTIESPATNTDRTLTLPDAAGTLNTSGAANVVPAGTSSAPAIYPSGDTNTGIFFPAADKIGMTVGGTDQFRLEPNGGMETFSNQYGLAIRSAQGAGTTYTLIYGARSSSGIALGTGVFEVYTNGDVRNTNGTYTTLSDQRLKENIVDANSQWDDIKSLQVRNFNFRADTGNDSHKQLGLIAQEVELVCPGLVRETAIREGEVVTDADGNPLESIKSVNISVLYMKAVKALQEAQLRIEALESQNAAFETRIAALEAK